MSDPAPGAKSSLLAKTLGPLLSDPPWAAKPFLAASATTVAGLGAWLTDMMSPALARGGASFLGGFLVGWAFRKTLKIALIITLSLAALEVNRTLNWAQGQAQSLKEVAVGYLPSAGAGVAGAFFGLRKK